MVGGRIVDDRGVPKTRLGVALLVPLRAAAGIDLLRAALGAGDAVHHIAPHVTLVPPVNVPVERVGEVEALVRRAAAAERPFAATLGPPDTFLPDNPVLYLRVGTEAALAALDRLRSAVFVEPLARPLTWPFTPHVTLMDGGEPERVAAGALALADHVVDVTLGGLALLQEQRDGEGVRVWRTVLEAPLGGPAVVGRGSLPLELSVGTVLGGDAQRWFDASWEDHDRHLSGPAWEPVEPVAVVARREGAVVGAAVGQVREGEASLERLLVDESVRGEGVGSHLLAAFVALAADRGCRRVVLRAVGGGAVERFYVDRGFTQLAALLQWRRGADFVLLARTLRAPDVSPT